MTGEDQHARREDHWDDLLGDEADVHDDLDLSFQLLLHDPASTRFDAGLRVGAAGRLFGSLDARVRQGRMALTTLRLNWAELSPGMRWVRRVQAAARP